jgi:hypothetical protein
MTDRAHRRWITAGAIAAVGLPAALAGAPAAAAATAATTHARLSVRVFANGSATMTQPDDITWLDGTVYTIWQNGVGPSGQPSSTGATASAVVGFRDSGHRSRRGRLRATPTA